jgi:hypothetical protein
MSDQYHSRQWADELHPGVIRWYDRTQERQVSGGVTLLDPRGFAVGQIDPAALNQTLDCVIGGRAHTVLITTVPYPAKGASGC